jgi:hypothetical protein
MNYRQMLSIAESLMPSPTDENPEYVRGMAELIALCFPRADIDTEDFAALITEELK